MTASLVQSGRSRNLAAGLVLLLVLLALVALASLAVGARAIPLGEVMHALIDPAAEGTNATILRDLRVPRTLLGLLVGAAVGLAGAIMQGVTRNPLADPGLLGINAGAALFVVLGISLFGLTSLPAYVWLGFAGAAVATVLVYSVASLGREGATPVKLALAGAAITAAFNSIVTGVLMTDATTLDAFRFWQVGSLAGRGNDVLLGVAPFLVAGIALALITGRLLDAMALGDDIARGLGQRVMLSRGVAALAWIVLAGGATAAAGPIAFVGLTVPHAARAITGPSYRWILPYCAVMAPILLLSADILGRVLAPPGELQVGIVTAAIGAPLFILLVRRRRLAEL
ncbi:MAG TPA: iron chelate uptake ABC transporter family permease subunit [Devosia sp.]|jgi:iron complex transport system permease protein|nr:iron chelate uptake ABC transporter family permease subunit [Devosia sp.]